MSNILEIEDLLQNYYKKEVISDLNLNVEEGCVLGKYINDNNNSLC